VFSECDAPSHHFYRLETIVIMHTEPNTYSRNWFDFFHVDIGEPRTMQETAFICRCAPLPCFRKIADLCCGMGRHARALSKHGYSVIGVDRDADAIAKARALAGGPTYTKADIREYRPEPGSFDVAMVMSQSFGYFDETTNRKVLGLLTDGVRKGGRVILDLWSAEFFVAHQGRYEFETPGGVVRETKRVEGGRLFVHLDYPDGAEDNFEWQLFSPAQMISMAESVGLRRLFVCTAFDETTPPSPTSPRVQFLFARGCA
jgi:SAM-dependent methyltransferase